MIPLFLIPANWQSPPPPPPPPVPPIGPADALWLLIVQTAGREEPELRAGTIRLTPPAFVLRATSPPSDVAVAAALGGIAAASRATGSTTATFGGSRRDSGTRSATRVRAQVGVGHSPQPSTVGASIHAGNGGTAVGIASPSAGLATSGVATVGLSIGRAFTPDAAAIRSQAAFTAVFGGVGSAASFVTYAGQGYAELIRNLFEPAVYATGSRPQPGPAVVGVDQSAIAQRQISRAAQVMAAIGSTMTPVSAQQPAAVSMAAVLVGNTIEPAAGNTVTSGVAVRTIAGVDQAAIAPRQMWRAGTAATSAGSECTFQFNTTTQATLPDIDAGTITLAAVSVASRAVAQAVAIAAAGTLAPPSFLTSSPPAAVVVSAGQRSDTTATVTASMSGSVACVVGVVSRLTPAGVTSGCSASPAGVGVNAFPAAASRPVEFEFTEAIAAWTNSPAAVLISSTGRKSDLAVGTKYAPPPCHTSGTQHWAGYAIGATGEPTAAIVSTQAYRTVTSGGGVLPAVAMATSIDAHGITRMGSSQRPLHTNIDVRTGHPSVVPGVAVPAAVATALPRCDTATIGVGGSAEPSYAIQSFVVQVSSVGVHVLDPADLIYRLETPRCRYRLPIAGRRFTLQEFQT